MAKDGIPSVITDREGLLEASAQFLVTWKENNPLQANSDNSLNASSRSADTGKNAQRGSAGSGSKEESIDNAISDTGDILHRVASPPVGSLATSTLRGLNRIAVPPLLLPKLVIKEEPKQQTNRSDNTDNFSIESVEDNSGSLDPVKALEEIDTKQEEKPEYPGSSSPPQIPLTQSPAINSTTGPVPSADAASRIQGILAKYSPKPPSPQLSSQSSGLFSAFLASSNLKGQSQPLFPLSPKPHVLLPRLSSAAAMHSPPTSYNVSPQNTAAQSPAPKPLSLSPPLPAAAPNISPSIESLVANVPSKSEPNPVPEPQIYSQSLTSILPDKSIEPKDHSDLPILQPLTSSKEEASSAEGVHSMEQASTDSILPQDKDLDEFSALREESQPVSDQLHTSKQAENSVAHDTLLKEPNAITTYISLSGFCLRT